jgi:hypothetical protein
MLRLFQAGLIAAGHQLVAVAAIGTVVSLLAGYDFVVPFGPSRISADDQMWAVVEPLLSWSDMLTAVGVVFTSAAYLERHRQLVGRRSRKVRCRPPYAAALTPVTSAQIEGLRADGSVLGGREVIAVKMKEVVDLVVGGEEPLRLAG